MSRSWRFFLLGNLIAVLFGMAIAGWRARDFPDRARSAMPAGTAPEAGRTPEASLVEAIQRESGVRRWLRILAASEEATGAEFPALMHLAGDDAEAVRLLAQRWAERAPRHMFQMLYAEALLPYDTPGLLPGSRDHFFTLFEHWVEADSAAAVAALSDSPIFSQRSNLRTLVVDHLLRRDEVSLAVAKIAEWNPDLSTADFANFRNWAAADPLAAVEAVLKINPERGGRHLLGIIGSEWVDTDPRAVLALAKTLPARSGEALAGSAFGRWADRDLAGALEAMTNEPHPAFREFLGKQLVSAWGRTDPAAAMAWSLETLHGEARRTAIGQIMFSAARSEPAKAATVVTALEEAPDREFAASRLFSKWATSEGGMAPALDWIASLPQAALRRAALEPGLEEALRVSPKEVLKIFDGPLAAELPRSAVDAAVQYQLAGGLDKAVQWAETLSPEQGKAARSSVYGSWVPANIAAAQAYAHKLPAGPARQELVTAIAQTLSHEAAPKAAAWVRTLNSEERRTAWTIFEKTDPGKRSEIEAELKVQ